MEGGGGVEQKLRNVSYLFLKFLMVKTNPLNVVSYNVAVYKDVTITLVTMKLRAPKHSGDIRCVLRLSSKWMKLTKSSGWSSRIIRLQSQ